jgi:hypothetical protein
MIKWMDMKNCSKQWNLEVINECVTLSLILGLVTLSMTFENTMSCHWTQLIGEVKQ